jgi:hypothetical protein
MMGEDYDPTLTPGVLDQINGSISHSAHRVTRSGKGIHLAGGIQAKPILASVIQLAKRHTLSIPVVETFGSIAHG